jgi:hypothetical protein
MCYGYKWYEVDIFVYLCVLLISCSCYMFLCCIGEHWVYCVEWLRNPKILLTLRKNGGQERVRNLHEYEVRTGMHPCFTAS